MPLELADAAVEAVVLDLDGTLYVGEEPVAGAVEAVARLRRRGLALRFLTNTTSRGRGALTDKLRRLGFDVDPAEVFCSPTAAAEFLRRRGDTAHLLVQEGALPDFEAVPREDVEPDWVVVGDLGDAWSFARLNDAFRMVHERGAGLIGLVRSRYWTAPDGPRLDAGPFVAALEFATGVTARVFGKPDPEIFRVVLDSLGLSPERVAMVGDDAQTDVAAAQAVGMSGVLVRTGKYREAGEGGSELHPDDHVGAGVPRLVLDSVADLGA